MAKKRTSPKTQKNIPFRKRTVADSVPTVVELGIETERRMDARAGARAFGYEDIPGARIDDGSDLNLGRHASVDSVSGGASTGDASDLTEFDTITDSNSLTSASLLEGAFRGDTKPATVSDRTDARNAAQRARRDTEGEATRATTETDAVFSAKASGRHGVRDVPDAETLAGYTDRLPPRGPSPGAKSRETPRGRPSP